MLRPGILYDKIGKRYNSTRKADPYIAQRLFDLLSLRPEKLYLDIGCGTGNYTIALSKDGIKFCGVDPSQNMLEVAYKKSNSVRWLMGSSENIPVKDNSFDGGMATLTIHHWANIENAFLELNRVLKIHSHLVIFTSLPEQMNGYWLNHYFPKMMRESIEKMPALRNMEDAALKGGFNICSTEIYNIQIGLQDHFLYSGKLNPSLYLNDNIRFGISSFSDLNNKDEIRTGLKKLKDDIDNKSFAKVNDDYINDFGDYLFIIFKKNKEVRSSNTWS